MIDIRPITTLADMRAAEALQTATWQMPPDELMSAHSLHALAHNGAALIGAYDGDRLVGMVLGVLATVPNPQRPDQPAAERLKMYSVMAGVLPAYQGQGIGRRLKLAQREFALQLGVPLITWTFDPLESRNGRLNIAVLGVTCCTYHRHFHGDMGGLNAGLPTDRFDVDWWLSSERVVSRVRGEARSFALTTLIQRGVGILNTAVFDGRDLPVPPDRTLVLPRSDQPYGLVEIPANFQAIKTADFALARAWRLHTRELFETLFAAGFIVTEFFHKKGGDGRSRSYYLLQTTSDAP
ncbi:MAG: GNAT family N-acetyltransferase [Ardenticatenaceae bacterium]|nr:GNAT family N-acetyltransferase [Ardenticatenaceae bacterium]MCB8987218.1 GNAT family N-acetyltransferase [Ardenticatenaceae bacterium]